MSLLIHIRDLLCRRKQVRGKAKRVCESASSCANVWGRFKESSIPRAPLSAVRPSVRPSVFFAANDRHLRFSAIPRAATDPAIALERGRRLRRGGRRDPHERVKKPVLANRRCCQAGHGHGLVAACLCCCRPGVVWLRATAPASLLFPPFHVLPLSDQICGKQVNRRYIRPDLGGRGPAHHDRAACLSLGFLDSVSASAESILKF